jgi:cobaltochelatase CobS
MKESKQQIANIVLDELTKCSPRRVRTNVIYNRVKSRVPNIQRRALVNCLKGLAFSGKVNQRGNKAFLWSINNDSTEGQKVDPTVVELMKKQLEDLKAELEKTKAEKETGIAEIHIKRGGKTQKIKGLLHKEFARLVTLCEARMNIMLYGPTGSGKSYICQQLADKLKLDFGFVSCTTGMSEGQVGGRLLPVGKQGTFEYVVSEFVKCFENGGIFLADEMDAADPNVLLFFNAALANDVLAVPNRTDKPYAKRHKDFIFIGACNTVGTGADRMYSGRTSLDASTLDRFQVGKVFIDYDERVERELCPDAELLERLHVYRQRIQDNRLERAMSTRFIRDAYRMKTDFGWSNEDLDRTFFAGWREDEKNKVCFA